MYIDHWLQPLLQLEQCQKSSVSGVDSWCILTHFMYPLTALYQLYQLFWLIIDITTQQLLYNLSPTSTIHEIHHRSSTLISELLLIDSIQLHNHGTIIINFIDVITIGRLGPVTLSVSLVSCRGSCVTPCRQPGASKHTPTTRRIQVGIATRTVVSQRTVLSTVLLYYEQQQWTRDCAHSCWTYLIVATRKVLSLWQ